MSAIAAWLEAEHRELGRMLDASVRGDALDLAAFRSFRARLLRHIAVEEKVILRAAREARGGVPIPRAETIRREHGAIAALLVPTPDLTLARELETLLRPHEAREEGPDGVYAECAVLVGAREAEIAAEAAAFPAVPPAPFHDGPNVCRTAAEASALSARMRPPRTVAPALRARG